MKKEKPVWMVDMISIYGNLHSEVFDTKAEADTFAEAHKNYKTFVYQTCDIWSREG